MSPMAERPRTILICSCEDTMPLDGEAVRRACRDTVVIEGRQFCRAELERFRKAAAGADRLSSRVPRKRLFSAKSPVKSKPAVTRVCQYTRDGRMVRRCCQSRTRKWRR